eukprot:5221524-Alexandrium_andersonii.AAC.1
MKKTKTTMTTTTTNNSQRTRKVRCVHAQGKGNGKGREPGQAKQHPPGGGLDPLALEVLTTPGTSAPAR